MKTSSVVCLLALVVMVSTTPQVPVPFYPVPGIPISNDNSKSKPIAPTVPVPGVTPAESKPKEWLSSTPTVADRSRCLADYRSKKPDAPPPTSIGMASPHQYPFLVSFVDIYEETKELNFYCSGSLISPTQILTFDSCLTNSLYYIKIPLENLRVRLGTQYLNETHNYAQMTRKVKEIIFDDILIVTMDSPVEYSDTISPVCLVPDCFDDDSGQSVIATGWKYPPHSYELETKLKAFVGFVRLSTLLMEKCYAKDVHGNPDKTLCAQSQCGDFCNTYRGGPVVIENNSQDDTSCRFMQIGVFGNFAGHSNLSTFVRVKHYLTWIEENSK
ncbi:hypothetical protein DAPPUDRAFT_236061 [Daphnia pulex]|uniref:Peptidase S1 domain-containing protein n=1 Tax=Daphnia pulex TaxID=6669 RepID=E9FZV3_DAPPU|nr:hypothetical protein DAPPUDRAFT_236061 [Daphnia pulex]|eukprot:EFX87197.1 hypothetical protein DAPPUDRAFT_236061 [Daphnia pulex]